MINLIKIDNTYNVPIREYEVDSASELEEITGAPIGSTATVVSTGAIYKLNGEGVWVQQRSGGGGGGSSELPTPGTAGNVLTSTGTAWESAAPTVNDYIVHGTINKETFAVTVDATYVQIAAAVDTNKNVFLVAKDTEETVAMFGRLEMFLASTSATFFAVLYMPGGYKTFVVIVNANDVVETGTIDTLPLVSSSNNGKVLGVVNGAYELVDSKAPLILSGTYAAGTAPDPDTVTISGATLAEIYNAAEAGRYVAVDVPLPLLDGTTVRFELRGRNFSNDEYALAFNAVIDGSVQGYLFTILCENSLTGAWAVKGLTYTS